MKKYFFTFLIVACAATCFGQTTKEGLGKSQERSKDGRESCKG